MEYYKGVCGRMHKLIDGCPACDDIEAEKRINKMKDDSLDDTGTRKPTAKADARYCHQCDRSMPLAGCHICNPNLFATKPDAIKALAQSKTDINKLGRVDIERLVTSTDSVYAKEIWNAAIEAAAELAEGGASVLANEIRKLKK